MSKRLRDLRYFDEAVECIRLQRPLCLPFVEAAGNVIVPGLEVCSVPVLESIAGAYWAQGIERSRRLRLLPQPKREAANDV